jgi:hypothetical protein
MRAIITIAVLLMLTGCHNGITYDSGSGGVITQHITQGDYGQVLRMANDYCRNHNLGMASVNKVHDGCVYACGTENDQYEFKCAAN